MILVDSDYWRPLLTWIDDVIEDDGLISPDDKELLHVADTPEQVCELVTAARERQRTLTA
jgi:predicted Rossmann-fold nucleotide-binding protein